MKKLIIIALFSILLIPTGLTGTILSSAQLIKDQPMNNDVVSPLPTPPDTSTIPDTTIASPPAESPVVAPAPETTTPPETTPAPSPAPTPSPMGDNLPPTGTGAYLSN